MSYNTLSTVIFVPKVKIQIIILFPNSSNYIQLDVLRFICQNNNVSGLLFVIMVLLTSYSIHFK